MEYQFIIQQLINGFSRGAVYSLVAVGFAIIFSVLKFSNFAHGGMISVAAFIGYFTSRYLHTGLVLTIIASALAGGFMGIILDFIGFYNLRKRKSPRIFYFVSSITCGILFMNVLTIFFGSTYYALPAFFDNPVVTAGGMIIVKLDIVAFFVSMMLIIVLMLFITKTRIGLAIRTVALDDNTAMLMGINSNTIVRYAFFLAGALAGMAGVMLAANYTVDPFLGNLVVKGFVASVIGGLGSLLGAVLGAFLLGGIEVFITVIAGDLISPAVIFILTLVFLLVRPRGLAGKSVQQKA